MFGLLDDILMRKFTKLHRIDQTLIIASSQPWKRRDIVETVRDRADRLVETDPVGVGTLGVGVCKSEKVKAGKCNGVGEVDVQRFGDGRCEVGDREADRRGVRRVCGIGVAESQKSALQAGGHNAGSVDYHAPQGVAVVWSQ